MARKKKEQKEEKEERERTSWIKRWRMKRI